MENHTWPAGTPIQCNRCHAKITLDHAVQSTRFCGSFAARITSLERCQQCNTIDSHWILSADVAPDLSRPGFYYSQYQRNCAMLEWRRNN